MYCAKFASINFEIRVISDSLKQPSSDPQAIVFNLLLPFRYISNIFPETVNRMTGSHFSKTENKASRKIKPCVIDLKKTIDLNSNILFHFFFSFLFVLQLIPYHGCLHTNHQKPRISDILKNVSQKIELTPYICGIPNNEFDNLPTWEWWPCRGSTHLFKVRILLVGQS